MISIVLSSLITVLCVNYSDTDQCESWLNRCYKEGINDKSFDKYKEDYKKANVFVSCLQKGKYLRE